MLRNKVKLPFFSTIYFYIDAKNETEIMDFLKDKGTKRLQHIAQQINAEVATKDVYSNENYNKDIKYVTAIKFKGKHFNNARIYCKDYKIGEQRIIVLCELLKSKKQNKLTQQETNLITKVNNYDYE